DTFDGHLDLARTSAADRELLATVARVMRDTAMVLSGGDARPDLAALEIARSASAAHMRQTAGVPAADSHTGDVADAGIGVTASAAGATALRALAGTVVGFVVGAALLLVIGTGQASLWLALPIAVLVASYAPGTAPCAVGQAAFTVTVVVLFNLLVPVGWKVG